MERISPRLLAPIDTTGKMVIPLCGILRVGDLVLVNDDTTFHCHCWPLVRVVHVMPDRFGGVRRVVVRKGPSAKSEFEKNIRKLCLFDASI